MKFILFSKVAALRQNTAEQSVAEKKALVFVFNLVYVFRSLFMPRLAS